MPTVTGAEGSRDGRGYDPVMRELAEAIERWRGRDERVAVATVLAMEPEILVLDEPSSNLDPVARRELAEVLLGLDTTMLMVTHDLPYALQLCPRSVVLDDGVVVADGPTRELLGDAELLRRHRLELPYGFSP